MKRSPITVIRLTSERPRDTAPHRHERTQLFLLSRGLLSVETEQARWVMPPGRLGLIPAGAEHAASSPGLIEGWSAYLSPALLPELTGPSVRSASELVLPLLARAANWDATTPPTPAQRRLLAVLLDEVRAAPQEPLRLPFPQDRRLALIAKGLLADPSDTRDAAAWAATAGLSTRTLSRLFVAQTGLSFSHWRQWARLVKALEWLACGESVQNTAWACGYGSVSAFIQVFKKHLGRTPQSYRPGG